MVGQNFSLVVRRNFVTAKNIKEVLVLPAIFGLTCVAFFVVPLYLFFGTFTSVIAFLEGESMVAYATWGTDPDNATKGHLECRLHNVGYSRITILGINPSCKCQIDAEFPQKLSFGESAKFKLFVGDEPKISVPVISSQGVWILCANKNGSAHWIARLLVPQQREKP